MHSTQLSAYSLHTGRVRSKCAVQRQFQRCRSTVRATSTEFTSLRTNQRSLPSSQKSSASDSVTLRLACFPTASILLSGKYARSSLPPCTSNCIIALSKDNKYRRTCSWLNALPHRRGTVFSAMFAHRMKPFGVHIRPETARGCRHSCRQPWTSRV